MIITKNDILSEEDRLLIVKDIQYELKHNPTPNKLKPYIKQRLTYTENMLKYINIGIIFSNQYMICLS